MSFRHFVISLGNSFRCFIPFFFRSDCHFISWDFGGSLCFFSFFVSVGSLRSLALSLVRQALVQLEHVRFLKIEGAPPEEVERLVAEKLGDNVVDISDSLFGLVEELCTGNPLMITELVSHLKVTRALFPSAPW